MKLLVTLMSGVILAGVYLTGCQSSSNPNAAPPMGSMGGVSGGGSTDVYGTDSNSRYRQGGNIGTSVGEGAGNPITVPQTQNTAATTQPIGTLEGGTAAPTTLPSTGTNTNSQNPNNGGQ